MEKGKERRLKQCKTVLRFNHLGTSANVNLVTLIGLNMSTEVLGYVLNACLAQCTWAQLSHINVEINSLILETHFDNKKHNLAVHTFC